MDPAPRRFTPRTIFAILVGAILLALGGIVLEIHLRANRAWASMEERTRVLIAEARTRPAARPVLSGVAEPGSAWTDYSIALREMHEIKSDIVSLYKILRVPPEGNVPATMKLVERRLGTLAHLLRGSRRGEGSFPYEWVRSDEITGPGATSSAGLCALARIRARQLLDAGRTGEAADLIFALLQFSGDCSRNAAILYYVSGLSMTGEGLRELRVLMASGRCTAEDFKEIARRLEILDASWPDPGITVRNEVMTHTIDLLARAPIEAHVREATTFDWLRFGFSYRLMAADASALIARSAVLLAELEGKPWSVCLERRSLVKEEFQERPNPLAPFHPGSPIFWSREKKAQLRLVRMEAHFLATGEALDLEDPYGTRLRHVASGDSIKIWSLGADGVDQGGQGTFEINGGNDIVVEATTR